MLLACSSKPPGVATDTGAGSATGSSGSAGSGGDSPILIGSAGDGTGHLDQTPPPDFFENTSPDAGTTACLTQDSCEALECGPIADNCGGFIDCGTCTLPATCGGAGVPSHCGVPGTNGNTNGNGSCVPGTCDSLNVSCGKQGDGCGGIIDCSTCDSGLECVQGQCKPVSTCTPLTCADYPEAGRCGPVSDGCSGILNCPFPACGNSESCGAQQAGFCGTLTCAPQSCEAALTGLPTGYCGFVSNGCDGALANCATVCAQGESCGVTSDAGGFVQVCTTGGGSGGGTCTPTDQVTACAGKCGSISDGCSGVYACGGCGTGEICGAQQANVCGTVSCTPHTCTDFNAECGSIDDGCGGTLTCGSCSNGDTCAGGGVPYECGSPTCNPLSQSQACTAAHASCGLQSDGCSGTVNCGTCTNGETCGGGGVANQCGASCTPRTCDVIGANCGPQGDGCGGQIDCGTCTGGQVCRGTPTRCLTDPSCTNFCTQQVSCQAGQETSVSGKVYAPNGTEALYNALVYVPNLGDLSALPAISSGASCERCADEDLGNPLVAAITGPDGSFTLKNVPAGVDFPLVVKMGKWRRVTMIPAVGSCSQNALSVDDARLPRHMNDAASTLTQFVNIPKTALVTGKVDAIECVLRKIGVADSEFSAPSGNGRIHLYVGQGSGTYSSKGAGTSLDGSSNVTGTPDSTLFTGTTLNNYDVSIFDCEGNEYVRSAARQNALNAYADLGGRIFASHYSYTYLDGVNPKACSAGTCSSNANCGGGSTCVSGHCSGTCTKNSNCGTSGVCSATSNTSSSYLFGETATWNGPANNEGATTTGIIDTSHAKGQAFDAWLGNVNAWAPTYGDGNISIIDPREFVQSVTSGITERFVYTEQNHYSAGLNATNSVQQYSFNTPVGAADDATCGRVVYSAFHVAGVANVSLDTHAAVFPAECNSDPLTAQEKILEFMIFDLSSCVSPSVPPTCAPKSCADLGKNCGYISDGCGGIESCGTCSSPQTCGGGGTPNVCGSSCTLKTCASAGATCGIIGDGCGGTLDCGTCSSGSVCGGGGTANVCGTPACTPRTCASVAANCGFIGDGCGGTLNCGTCSSGSCGGGGPNKCGTGTCTPTGCGSATCGSVGDGCGGVVSCGVCPSGSICGAGGANKCGAVCTPQTCVSAGNKNCGYIGDGCGGVLDCGVCSEGVVCGGGGTPNVCGGTCSAVTCTSAHADCGTLSDGCGGVLTCGSCPAGQVCGAQQANKCGSGSCTPVTCQQNQCGTISDGCSGTLDCGPCNGCTPYQCTQYVDCGPVADGCGGLVDCGGCANGDTCGGGGHASKCGGGIH